MKFRGTAVGAGKRGTSGKIALMGSTHWLKYIDAKLILHGDKYLPSITAAPSGHALQLHFPIGSHRHYIESPARRPTVVDI